MHLWYLAVSWESHAYPNPIIMYCNKIVLYVWNQNQILRKLKEREKKRTKLTCTNMRVYAYNNKSIIHSHRLAIANTTGTVECYARCFMKHLLLGRNNTACIDKQCIKLRNRCKYDSSPFPVTDLHSLICVCIYRSVSSCCSFGGITTAAVVVVVVAVADVIIIVVAAIIVVWHGVTYCPSRQSYTSGAYKTLSIL